MPRKLYLFKKNCRFNFIYGNTPTIYRLASLYQKDYLIKFNRKTVIYGWNNEWIMGY